MSPWRVVLVVVLALGGAAVSGLLLLQHHGEATAVSAVNQVCGEGDSGCATVARSAYSELHGIPLAAIGLLFYLSVGPLLLLATLSGAETQDAAAWLAFAVFAAAVVIDVMLLGVQAFVLHAYCKLCIVTYLLNVLAVVLLLPARRSGAALFRALALVDGRLALAGWLLSSAAFAAAVSAADRALNNLEAGRTVNVLGVPGSPGAAVPHESPATAPPAPAASPTPAGSAPAGSDLERSQQQLRQAQQEALRLQGILDDPKKLEQYFAEKAVSDFDKSAVYEFDVRETPNKGIENAPIRVVEFSDFLCPYCRALAGAFSNYIPRSANRVSVYYKNYPLDKACNPNVQSTVHAGACWVALGAVCALEQGKFWQYHDKAFGTDLKNPQSQEVVKVATDAGLNGPALESCLASPRTKERLASDINDAARVGVTSTPTVFVNGKRLPRVNDFLAIVEKEAARLGIAAPAQPPDSR